MVSEVSTAGGANPALVPAAFARAAPPSTAATAVDAQASARPKVVAPKPTDIKFDANQATQNLKAAVSMLNEQMASTNRGLGFSFDESKKSAVIKVTDIKSGEVVRQIPSEDVLRMAHKIDDLKGILYNKIA